MAGYEINAGKNKHGGNSVKNVFPIIRKKLEKKGIAVGVKYMVKPL